MAALDMTSDSKLKPASIRRLTYAALRERWKRFEATPLQALARAISVFMESPRDSIAMKLLIFLNLERIRRKGTRSRA